MKVVPKSKNMRLKSWESPRSEGRNSKGKGGSARARQLKKQQQTLRKQLKAQNDRLGDRQNYRQNNQGKEINISFPSSLITPIAVLNLGEVCPMPYALCPMPYALCPMPYALCPSSENTALLLRKAI
jgi:hypothetical protein